MNKCECLVYLYDLIEYLKVRYMYVRTSMHALGFFYAAVGHMYVLRVAMRGWDSGVVYESSMLS